jgi:hypothetical protein
VQSGIYIAPKTPERQANQIGTDQTALILGTETRTFQVNWVAVGGNKDIYIIVNEAKNILEPSYSNNVGKKSIDPQLKLTVRKLDMTHGCLYSPLSGITATVCRSTGESIGLNGNTDNEGGVIFSLTPGNYKFRIDYQGYTFWSNTLSFPCTSNPIVDIQHRDVKLTVTPTFDNSPVTLTGQYPVRVFSEDGLDTLFETNTYSENSHKCAVFSLPEKCYKFRLNYGGYEFWSDPTTWNDVEIELNIAKATITFMYGTVEESGVPIYAYSIMDNEIENIITDSNGEATFFLTANTYKFNGFYNGTNYWSDMVTLDEDVTKNIEINTDGSTITIKVEKYTNAGISGVNVYATCTLPGSPYISVPSLTNNNGEATLRLPDGDYILTAEYLGYEFTSDEISMPTSNVPTIVIDHHDVIVTFQKSINSQSSEIANIEINLCMSNNEYLGESEITDQDGQVTFNIPEEEYSFTGTYMGYPFSSEPSSYSGIPITIELEEMDVYVFTGYDSTEDALSGVTAILYTLDENNNGLTEVESEITDVSGNCIFYIPDEEYKFKVEYLIYDYWSEIVSWEELEPEMIIEEGRLELTVESWL